MISAFELTSHKIIPPLRVHDKWRYVFLAFAHLLRLRWACALSIASNGNENAQCDDIYTSVTLVWLGMCAVTVLITKICHAEC